MRFIVGLGNPGLAHRVTRHNVGFMVISRLGRTYGISVSRRRFGARYGEGTIRGQKVLLVKPHTYMNVSGPPVKSFVALYEASLRDLIVIHDDMDLTFGSIRIKRSGGHGGHKGVRSIMEATGGSDFIRIKLGIGHPEGTLSVTDYVLSPFTKEERGLLDQILSRAIGAIEMILVEGVDNAMNVCNAAVIRENGEA